MIPQELSAIEYKTRLYKRYLHEDVTGFTHEEMIELLLTFCTNIRDVRVVAQNLFHQFGSLSAIMDAHVLELSAAPGMSARAAVLCSMLPSMFNRYYRDVIGYNTVMTDPSIIGRYCVFLCGNRTRETFYCISLDERKRLIKADKIAEGGISQAVVYPRDVMECVLMHNASYVIITHNHPSGVLIPSEDDINTTVTVTRMLQSIGVEVLDHMIVSARKYYSFVKRNVRLMEAGTTEGYMAELV